MLISCDDILVINQIEMGPFTAVTTHLSRSTWGGGKRDVKPIDGREFPKLVHDSVVTNVKGSIVLYSMIIIFLF